MLQHRLDQGNSAIAAIAAIDVIDDCDAVLAQVFSQALTSVMQHLALGTGLGDGDGESPQAPGSTVGGERMGSTSP